MAAFGPAAKLAPALGPWFGLAALLALLLRSWQPFREMSLRRDESETARLTARVSDLEAKLERMEAASLTKDARHEAEMTIMRHRLNNETASLDALLMLLETAPDKVRESLAMIKEMRAVKAQAIATERGAANGARMAAAGKGGDV